MAALDALSRPFPYGGIADPMDNNFRAPSDAAWTSIGQTLSSESFKALNLRETYNKDIAALTARHILEAPDKVVFYAANSEWMMEMRVVQQSKLDDCVKCVRTEHTIAMQVGDHCPGPIAKMVLEYRLIHMEQRTSSFVADLSKIRPEDHDLVFWKASRQFIDTEMLTRLAAFVPMLHSTGIDSFYNTCLKRAQFSRRVPLAELMAPVKATMGMFQIPTDGPRMCVDLAQQVMRVNSDQPLARMWLQDDYLNKILPITSGDMQYSNAGKLAEDAHINRDEVARRMLGVKVTPLPVARLPEANVRHHFTEQGFSALVQTYYVSEESVTLAPDLTLKVPYYDDGVGVFTENGNVHVTLRLRHLIAASPIWKSNGTLNDEADNPLRASGNPTDVTTYTMNGSKDWQLAAKNALFVALCRGVFTKEELIHSCMAGKSGEKASPSTGDASPSPSKEPPLTPDNTQKAYNEFTFGGPITIRLVQMLCIAHAPCPVAIVAVVPWERFETVPLTFTAGDDAVEMRVPTQDSVNSNKAMWSMHPLTRVLEIWSQITVGFYVEPKQTVTIPNAIVARYVEGSHIRTKDDVFTEKDSLTEGNTAVFQNGDPKRKSLFPCAVPYENAQRLPDCAMITTMVPSYIAGLSKRIDPSVSTTQAQQDLCIPGHAYYARIWGWDDYCGAKTDSANEGPSIMPFHFDERHNPIVWRTQEHHLDPVTKVYSIVAHENFTYLGLGLCSGFGDARCKFAQPPPRNVSAAVPGPIFT